MEGGLIPAAWSPLLTGIGGRAGRSDPTIREDLARVLALRAEGKLTPVIGARLPLTDARRAPELIERAGVGGKLVLEPSPRHDSLDGGGQSDA